MAPGPPRPPTDAEARERLREALRARIGDLAGHPFYVPIEAVNHALHEVDVVLEAAALSGSSDPEAVGLLRAAEVFVAHVEAIDPDMPKHMRACFNDLRAALPNRTWADVALTEAKPETPA
jgi:hypothetical protein